MKPKRYAALAVAFATLLLTGCTQAGAPAAMHLDPAAPAAHGLPDRPGPGEPVPLAGREPFGLFREKPAAETLPLVATGLLGPTGRYRAAMTPQGAWVTRIDGAWLWQIEAPPLPPPPGKEPEKPPLMLPPGPAKPAEPQTPPPAILALEWMQDGTLLLKDEAGRWLKANPDWARVTLLPAALQGKYGIRFSPDGSQVLYYTVGAGGEELWIAAADGTNPKKLGVKVTGWWDAQGNPVIREAAAARQQIAPVQLGRSAKYTRPLE